MIWIFQNDLESLTNGNSENFNAKQNAYSNPTSCSNEGKSSLQIESENAIITEEDKTVSDKSFLPPINDKESDCDSYPSETETSKEQDGSIKSDFSDSEFAKVEENTVFNSESEAIKQSIETDKKSDVNSAAEENIKEEIIEDDPVCEEWEWEDEEENEYEFLELEDEKYKVETFDGSFSICLNS